MMTNKQKETTYMVRRSFLGVKEKKTFGTLEAAETEYARMLAEAPEAFLELSEVTDMVTDVIRFQCGEVRFER
jgi:hypothetical protein